MSTQAKPQVLTESEPLKDEIILSICIASYNHGHHIHPLIERLLTYTGDDLEIVVSDNRSTDDTVIRLESIKDKRVKLLKGNENRGPTANYMRALAAGSGKYVMFMTDKDTLDASSLPLVIQALRTHTFATGYFALDYSGEQQNIQFCSSRKECFKHFAYLSKHPTGYVFNNAALKKLNIEKHFSDTAVVGFFPFEFLAAELCMHGNCALLAIKFCITGKLVLGQQKETSMTYSEAKQNLFFSPAARFEMFERYAVHLTTMDLSRGVRLSILRGILQRAYFDATHNYLTIINNEAMRIHYGISSTTVAKANLKNLRRGFHRSLLRSKVFKNDVEKLTVIKCLCDNA